MMMAEASNDYRDQMNKIRVLENGAVTSQREFQRQQQELKQNELEQ